jgi:hypothetical protein
LEPNDPLCGGPNTTKNDKGHLLSRESACDTTQLPTYLNQGFLAWDPTQKLTVPGEDVLDDGLDGGLVPAVRNMVIGVGQIGCQYPSQLESWYRFLVDPEPYLTIEVDPNTGFATPNGTDIELLVQRAEFLRPDSLLAVIMLSDKNDCSVKELGQNFYALQQQQGGMPFRLPRARAVCATNPNDACCFSCGQTNIPSSCPPDPTCMENGQIAMLTEAEDNYNLRCFDQKRRFGIDFLYATDRYVHAITNVQIQTRAGQLVPNPIFSDLNPEDDLHTIRDPGMVFLTGIIGVPWQDIANDPGDLTKGFKYGGGLSVPDPNLGQKNVWDIIVGDPATGIKPLDPLMIESIQERMGTNPITGQSLVNAMTPLGNSINGHERPIAGDDLQYTCIFPLATPRDCSSAPAGLCDCNAASADNPLCVPNPNDGMQPTMQVRAKAYPSLRQLAVLKGLGEQGTVGSVCPAQHSNPAGADYGYRQAIEPILDRLKPASGKWCEARKLPAGEDGRISCAMLEARHAAGGCQCDPNEARQPVSAEVQSALDAILTSPAAKDFSLNCACEIPQLAGDALHTCQYNLDEPVQLQDVNGWCYIDATSSPPIGDPKLVAGCPLSKLHRIRQIGKGEPAVGGTLFFVCSGD